ncbi:MAG: hypothetical protein A2283_24330 [Lentisphaerae bacterium RIFOXYA12_FULL_48_11]|nr:MAG: hypothetical protein A2283_24330 [Lentisphaerae bacterium RIFOXYA12_FULL_48_11]
MMPLINPLNLTMWGIGLIAAWLFGRYANNCSGKRNSRKRCNRMNISKNRSHRRRHTGEYPVECIGFAAIDEAETEKDEGGVNSKRR